MTTTRSQAVADDVSALLRARNPLIWIVSREEARVERYLALAATSAKYALRTWDVAAGIAQADGKPDDAFPESQDPGAALNFIREQSVSGEGRGVWVLRDFPTWLSGPAGARTLRELRNLARALPTAETVRAQAVVVLSPSGEVPAELADHATVIEWPLPDRAEIAATLDACLDALPEDVRAGAAPNGKREAAIDAAVGLSEEEAQACYARSLVQTKRIDAAVVASEKRRVIARERILEYYEPFAGGLEAVGGLENLKAWLLSRTLAFSPAARSYGLPTPKGTLIVGIPGTGKTLTAKAIATAWGVPLIKMDLGALKSKFVGDSEANIRKAFKVIEAIGRCVLWIDEIEKALQGATSGSSDGGTSADQLGAILNWMQERSSVAFVIATANDVSALPPELLRKGRFDEVWWVDLPTRAERAAVLAATLRGFGKGADVELETVADATDGFTGSEIAALVPEAMFAAFAEDQRDVATLDLVAAAKATVPLSKTAPEKISKMRDWAKGKTRPASAPEQKTDERRVRSLELA